MSWTRIEAAVEASSQVSIEVRDWMGVSPAVTAVVRIGDDELELLLGGPWVSPETALAATALLRSALNELDDALRERVAASRERAERLRAARPVPA